MMLARRDVILGSAALLSAGGMAIGLAAAGPTPHAWLAGLRIDGDVLLLHGGGGDAAALLNELMQRSGRHRIADRRIALLDRTGFAAGTALLSRARDVHLLALLPSAQSLVLESMLRRRGVAAVLRDAPGNAMLLAARLN